MLMKRICPFCKSELGTNSVYFCTSCGNVLPDSLQLKYVFKNIKKASVKKKNPVINAKILKDSLEGFTEIFSLKSVIMGVVLGLVLSLGFYLFSRLTNSNISSTATNLDVKNPNSNVVVPNEEAKIKTGSIEMNLDLKSGPFGQKKVHEYIPYDAELYMEFNDSSTLEPYFGFLGGEFFTLTENIKGKIDPFYVAFSMTKGIKRGWVVITFITDENINLGTYKTVTTERIDSLLLISSEPVLIDEIRLAKAGISKNLALHPILISTKPTIPAEGKIFILKTTNKDRNRVIDELMEKTYSSELKSVIEKFRDLETNHLVIQ